MQSFFVSFFTALVVAAGVSAAMHFGLAAELSPPPAVESPDRVEVPNLTGMTHRRCALGAQGNGPRHRQDRTRGVEDDPQGAGGLDRTGADVAPGSTVTVMINDEEWEE